MYNAYARYHEGLLYVGLTNQIVSFLRGLDLASQYGSCLVPPDFHVDYYATTVMKTEKFYDIFDETNLKRYGRSINVRFVSSIPEDVLSTCLIQLQHSRPNISQQSLKHWITKNKVICLSDWDTLSSLADIGISDLYAFKHLSSLAPSKVIRDALASMEIPVELLRTMIGVHVRTQEDFEFA